MHPGSKDYTQRVIAGSILLDGALLGLAEEFLWPLGRCQFERPGPFPLGEGWLEGLSANVQLSAKGRWSFQPN
jgi:hypothetical protein